MQDLRGRPLLRPLLRLLPMRAALPCSLLGVVVRLAAALLNSQPGAVVRDALPGSLRGMSEEGTGVPVNCSSGGGTGTAAVPAQQTAADMRIPSYPRDPQAKLAIDRAAWVECHLDCKCPQLS